MNQTSPENLPSGVRHAALATLACYYALILLFTADSLRLGFGDAPTSVAVFFWLLRVLPLAIFMPGLHRRSPRSAAWLSFVILMYFVHAVTTAFLPETRVYGIIYSLLCVAQFTSLVLFINLARKSGLSLRPES